MTKRVRKLFSEKIELLEKAKEASMSAVQIFNNPLIKFKSETFIVLMMIAWTYLLHAYYRTIKVDYRYYTKKGKRKKYIPTSTGKYRYWDLEKCLDAVECPLEPPIKKNLKLLIVIRHEIEHLKTNKIDEELSPKLFACALNFNMCMKKLFGNKFSLDREMGLAIQFSSFARYQIDDMKIGGKSISAVGKFITKFEENLNDNIKQSPLYSFSIFLIPQIVNKPNKSNQIIEFLKLPSEEIEKILDTHKVLISKQNILDLYPFTTTQVVEEIQKLYPETKKNTILTELHKLKTNKEYHAYNFFSSKWKKEYEKNGTLKQYTNAYNQNAINKVIENLTRKM